MCQFFSFITKGDGKIYYASAELRGEPTVERYAKYDSHSWLADNLGKDAPRKCTPVCDFVNKYEYAHGEFRVDQINVTDDRDLVQASLKAFIKTEAYTKLIRHYDACTELRDKLSAKYARKLNITTTQRKARFAKITKANKLWYTKAFKKASKGYKTYIDGKYVLAPERFKFALKFKQKEGIFANSTKRCDFNPFICAASSYGWWQFVIKIKGKVVFNTYHYSMPTGIHQRAVSDLMSQLGIKVDLYVNSRASLTFGLFGIQRDAYTKLTNLEIAMNRKGAHKALIPIRKKQIAALRRHIKKCARIGKKLSQKEIKRIVRDVHLCETRRINCKK